MLPPPVLSEMIEFISSSGKVEKLQIATNGSIIPSEEIMNLLKKRDVFIRISNYGLYPDKIEKLIQKFDEHGIKYSLYNFAGGVDRWSFLGGIDTPRTEDDELAEKTYSTCNFRSCLTLEKDELAYCSRATVSYLVQGFERKEFDYVKITDDPEFQQRFYKYLEQPHAMEACRYCLGTAHLKLIAPAVQIKY